MQSAQTLQSEAASILPAPSKESTALRWRAIREEVGHATEATAHPAESTVTECRIEHLPVSKLKEHAVAADVPPVKAEQMSEMVAEAEGTGIIGPRPLVVLPDRTTVIFGFHELVVARAAKLAFVPCVVADEPDPKAYALRNTLLIPQLTDDQRAVVALKLKEHLSKVLKSERGKTAAAA